MTAALTQAAHKWPAFNVRARPIADLVPYARNARTHSAEQVKQLAASLEKFGWTMPILADEQGGLIAGHGRVLAAQMLGYPEAPVMVAVGWSDQQKREYILADNQLALNAGWDESMLRGELSDLAALGSDLGMLGFSEDALAVLFEAEAEGQTEPDAVPETPAVPVSIAGDVWLLGQHRIICGSCTDPVVVQRVLAGARPHLMVTDPPYGVEYDPSWRVEPAFFAKRKFPGGKRPKPDSFASKGEVENDSAADWREAWKLFPGDVAYVWCSSLHVHTVAESLIACDFALRAEIIWRKPHFAIGRGDYHWQHEPCWYAVRAGASGHYQGDRTQTTVWDITSAVGFTTQTEGKDARTGHGTQKPVECMKRPIENNSVAGEAVYEPFSGSGSTIIAGELTGRPVHACELSPAYVDVAVKRWQEFTGGTATLEGDGGSFAEIAEKRLAT